MHKLFLLICFMVGFFEVKGQVTFSSAPESLQLYPRDNTDSAQVAIAGTVNVLGYTSVICVRSRNGILLDSTNIPLQYSGNSAPFQQNFRIKAERARYSIRVYIENNQNTTLVHSADSIVSGDVFLINGQSNGAAPNQGPGLELPNEWIRTYGTASFNATEAGQDTLWGLGQGSTTQSDFAIGVWGMKLARFLTDSLQVPVCFLNGSRFGTAISAHLPNPANHTDLSTIYGRLLFRTQKAGVAGAVKALFWYQGESNTDTSFQTYAALFQQLYNSWKNDFPGLSRIIAIQTRPGCLTGAAYNYHQQMREITRVLPLQYSDVVLMSTAGIPGFDGCHFLAGGYNQLGLQLYYLVQQEVYGQSFPFPVYPPEPVSASITGSSGSLLAIKMSTPVAWPPAFNGHQLHDYFYVDVPGVQPLNGWTSADTVYLQLSAPALVSKITYLPGIYYNGTTSVFQGPWLLNNRSVGAVSFANFPVQASIQILPPSGLGICAGDSVLLQANRSGLVLQWFMNGQPLAGKTGAACWVSSPGNYQVQLSDGFGNTSMSAALPLQQFTVTPVQLLQQDTSICAGEVIQLQAVNGVSYSWSDNSTSGSISVSQPGTYRVSAQDANGCRSADSVTVQVIPLPLADLVYAHGLTACVGDTITLSLSGNEAGVWTTGDSGQSLQVLASGFYSAVVTSVAGCTKASDTVFVNMISTPVQIAPMGPLSVCSNQRINLTATGSGIAGYQWFKDGILLDGETVSNFRPSLTGQYTVTIVDSFGCSTTSASTLVTVRNTPQATYAIANQFDNCADTIVTLTANAGSTLQYQWTRNGVNIQGATNRTFVTQQSGTYRVLVTNSWGCSKSSAGNTFPIAMPRPVITVNGPSVFCLGDSVELMATAPTAVSFQWLRNNNGLSGATNSSLYVKKSGNYKVVVTNAQGCSITSVGRPLSVSTCIGASLTEMLHSRAYDQADAAWHAEVWPNPFTSHVSLRLHGAVGDLQYKWLDITGRVIQEGIVPAGSATCVLQVPSRATGTCLLNVFDGGRQQVIRLFKED